MKAKHIVVPTLFALVIMGTGPASAQNDCKGLAESACGAVAGCG